MLSRLERDELVDVERWTGRDELCYALEAPIWDRFASLAGQPLIVGTVIWTTPDRRDPVEAAGPNRADASPLEAGFWRSATRGKLASDVRDAQVRSN